MGIAKTAEQAGGILPLAKSMVLSPKGYFGGFPRGEVARRLVKVRVRLRIVNRGRGGCRVESLPMKKLLKALVYKKKRWWNVEGEYLVLDSYR